MGGDKNLLKLDSGYVCTIHERWKPLGCILLIGNFYMNYISIKIYRKIYLLHCGFVYYFFLLHFKFLLPENKNLLKLKWLYLSGELYLLSLITILTVLFDLKSILVFVNTPMSVSFDKNKAVIIF